MATIVVLVISAILCSAAAAAADATGEGVGVPRCEPAALPGEFSSYAELCSSFRERPDSVFHDLFAHSPAPNATTQFPLRGCVYGCVVGNSFRADLAARPDNGGSWSGKCFRDFNGMLLPSSVINVVHSPDFQYEAEAFPGDLYLDDETWNRREAGSVWSLEYENSDIEFGRDFTGYRDEMRAAGPGVVVGKVFAKPFTRPLNPLNPFPLEAFHFMLFQVCNGDGGYPRYSFDRETKRESESLAFR